jgi:3-oxoacyl-[acyl-carrier-protein] synthase III
MHVLWILMTKRCNPLAKIIGVGSYVPERILSNQDLEKMVETSDEWIFSRTGMKERRIARVDEFTSGMGFIAARRAIVAAGIAPDQIDLIIFATITPDYAFPSTACLLQAALEAKKAAAFDIQAACSGYIYALSIAKAYVESGTFKNILVVASEKLSSIVNYKDRNTCVLFGDGAAAAIVSSDEKKGLKIAEIVIDADGTQAKLLMLPAGGCRNPATVDTVMANLHYMHMDGKEVYKHAVRAMTAVCARALEKLGISEEEVAWLIPHQANIRIIESVAKRFKIPLDKIYTTIEKYGNTSASAVGIALDEFVAADLCDEGDNILLVAFGSGLTSGAVVLTNE